MNLLLWLVLGALAGWIASMIVGKNASMGLGANILVGIIGAGIGGWIASFIGLGGISGFNLYSLLIAVGGAVVLLLILNLVRHS